MKDSTINLARKILPNFVLDWGRKYYLRKYKGLSTQEIFASIYKNSTWGGEKEVFFSGSGTYHSSVTSYMDFMVDFMKKEKIKKIVEIGCGDFNITKKILNKIEKVEYTGLDVVPDLIKHHQAINQTEHIKFQCLDAAKEVLPKGDLLVIRQVLQHLSNAQISQILKKSDAYPYVLITEHLPLEYGTPNLDKATGPDIRIYQNSGVYIELPPFNKKAKTVLESNDYEFNTGKKVENTKLRTSLIRN